MQEKRSKGLCFRCDENFGPGQLCKQKDLQVLRVLDEEELAGDEEITIFAEVEQKPRYESTTDPIEELSSPSLSLSSMVGLSAPHSLKIRGQIREQDVVVLIDSRASHNFIIAALVKELGLPVASTKDFGVVLDMGIEIRAIRVFWRVSLHLPEWKIIAYFFLIPLGSLEVILG